MFLVKAFFSSVLPLEFELDKCKAKAPLFLSSGRNLGKQTSLSF